MGRPITRLNAEIAEKARKVRGPVTRQNAENAEKARKVRGPITRLNAENAEKARKFFAKQQYKVTKGVVMRLSINNLRGRSRLLEDIIAEKENSLINVPDGTLKIRYSHGRPQYWKVSEVSGIKREEYIGIDEKRFAEILAQKSYDLKVLEKAQRELDALGKLIRQYEDGTFESISSQLSAARKELITPQWMSDDDFVKQWLEEPYNGLGFEEGDREYYSEKGLRVRSKSECDIANKYDQYGVPIKYEKPVVLKNGKIVYPDFTGLNIRRRSIFIHEHMGRMDDPAYLERNIRKIQDYQASGYYPGINLILTFETKNNPFDPRTMDGIIKQYLL